MAWIRRVRTASGATAVQIAESVDGRRRIVRHVGSAHDGAELGLLMAQARQLLEGDAQGELDLGLSIPVPRAAMVPAPSAATLFDDPAGPVGRRAVVAAPQVLRTSSAVLYDALAGVYTDLGFDALGDEVFRDLVIARLVEPTSLLDADRVLADLGRVSASLSTRSRTLRRCQDGAYRDQIAKLCFQHARASADVSLCLYDVTTLHFEAADEDALRKVGYSKERRVDPQIIVGLLVDRGGFPLEIGCWEGNKAETHTIVPIIEAFAARHQINDLVVVADAGMLSAANLKALDEAGHTFIVGSKNAKAPIDLASHFRWHGDAFTDGQVIDTLTPKAGKNKGNDPALRAEPVWDPEQYPTSWRAVWSYSARRFARDNKTLTAQENRAKAAIEGNKPARTPRFVKTRTDGLVLDDAALARARRLAGLKGLVTNIPTTVLPASEVISSYADLWHVEQSFRMSKSDLRARPLFARRRDSIEAHLTIVFTALAIARTVQARTGLSLRRVLRQLRPLRSATIEANGTIRTLPPALGPDEHALLNDLGQTDPRH
ncbi:IS1634 family transposase [Serinicoccus marinus]|uniref:IS1634 family transposase n=1 Tax=Serinicoccus marinus TaxID=247333 RepID=UPI00248FCFBC|nr:IS1634 family transposase [Serinicoccus marinus]